MGRFFVSMAAAVAALSAAPAAAGVMIAGNGVEVEVTADPFRPYVEYATADPDRGAAFAVRRWPDGRRQVFLEVVMEYRGEWRFYDRARLAGGAPLEFLELERKVGTCAVRPCWLVERFQIMLTPAQVRTAMASGDLELQVGARVAQPFTLYYPGPKAQAVLELSAR